MATLSSRGSRSKKSNLSNSLAGLSVNSNSIRQSLNMAAKWRQIGYNPFHPDAEGYTALHRAARKGDDALVKALLSTYDGDALEYALLGSTRQGHTAMHLASKGGHVKTAMVLYTAGKAVLGSADKHGNTPLHFAATSTAPDAFALLEWLLEHVSHLSLTKQNKYGLSPVAALVAIATADSAAMLRLFLERHVDPNATVRGENTLLHVCVDRRLYNMAGCLVEFGAALNIPDKAGVMVTDVVPEPHLGTLVKYVTTPQDWATQLRKQCMSCARRFTFFRRRHHCRLCGRTLCGSCTKHKMHLGLNAAVQEKVRVCHVCVTVVDEAKKAGSMTDVTIEADSPSMLS
ncbi:Aste57867_24972 [Aphanomyces stellatus]|uniref:Aste57867_24972 protein n=1 Tax=Aphanomyces stellatus TaxID=120398 RepID=A0A485LRX3_9STRA|nr:hypothetical protein As57867_024894 [Aphanomyces stellatus]VFU01603.1 Aste57867_24972 [Aphanomyces stellatus]